MIDVHVENYPKYIGTQRFLEKTYSNLNIKMLMQLYNYEPLT